MKMLGILGSLFIIASNCIAGDIKFKFEFGHEHECEHIRLQPVWVERLVQLPDGRWMIVRYVEYRSVPMYFDHDREHRHDRR
jgi:hypothetical protein